MSGFALELIAGQNPLRGRPRSEHPKVPIKTRLSPDVVDHFKAGGAGWQTPINETLKKAVAKEARKKKA